jgi:hypothetical protein
MEDLYFNLEELDNMSRSEIQALCKKFGIRANIKVIISNILDVIIFIY